MFLSELCAMNPSQSVVFVSCTRESPKDIIKLVYGDLPDGSELESGIISYPWHLNTKYYEAEIHLCTMENKSLSSATFAESVQGIIIYFDSEKSNGLQLVEEWLTFLKEYEAEVKILLCSKCNEKSDTGIDKLKIQEWCMKEEFELVEINPEIDEEWEAEQDFSETTGVKRVHQALEAHVWPYLVLKERKHPTSLSGLWHGGLCQSTASDHGNMASSLRGDNVEPTFEDLCDSENVDFCDLFSQLASMKERASNLPNDERKKYAEQLVLAYWNAIGGNEEEILDC